MRRYAQFTVLVTVGLASSCGGGDGNKKTEASSDASTADIVVEADTSGADTASSQTDPVCSESDLDACAYPEAGISVTVREGLSITDKQTGRVLPLLVRTPAGAGPFPVVIWSHGGGFNDNGEHLGAEWGGVIASQGYVVIHLAHVTSTKETGSAVCQLVSVPTAECGGSEDEDSGLLAVFRTLDMIAVMDGLQTLSDKNVEEGLAALDVAQVAIAGWSGGSRAPVVVMGATINATVSAPRFSKPDLRVKAAVALSPTGPGFGGFFNDGDGAGTSWDAMRGPVLLATGDMDVKPDKPDLTGPVRRFPFTAQPADGKRWLLYSNLPLGVGAHGTFNLGDDASPDERLARFSRALRSTVRAFLDAHLKGDALASAWLASDDAKVLAGDADWEHR